MFEKVTNLIAEIENTSTYGTWIIDETGAGTKEDPVHMPYVNYNDIVGKFVRN